MKREPVFEGELGTESVEKRLQALKKMYPREDSTTPEASEPELVEVSPESLWESPETQQRLGTVMMVCGWPGKVIRTGEATGVRYEFEGGREVPVDIRDVDSLLRVMRTIGGCCGHKKQRVQIFEYA